MRSESTSLLRHGLVGNRALVGAVALTVALQVLRVVVPVLRDILDLEALDASHWLLAVGIAFAYLIVVELDKAAHRHHRSTASAPASA